jgi:hypothetical protein
MIHHESGGPLSPFVPGDESSDRVYLGLNLQLIDYANKTGGDGRNRTADLSIMSAAL